MVHLNDFLFVVSAAVLGVVDKVGALHMTCLIQFWE